jgi:diguanylate cyclase (GGDEF)-like protein
MGPEATEPASDRFGERRQGVQVRIFGGIRTRLLALWLGLLLILGSNSFLMASFIERGQSFDLQRVEQQQRLQTVQSAEHALSSYRFWLAQSADPDVAGDPAARPQAQERVAQARHELDQHLREISRFDPEAAVDAGGALKDLVAEPPASRVNRARLATLEQTLLNAGWRELQRGDKLQLSANNSRFASLKGSAWLIVVTAALSLLLTVVIMRSIVEPLQKTITAIRQVNAGSAEVELPAARHDEFGDIAQALRQFHEQARYLRQIAYHDPLTGLANRANLEETLRTRIQQSVADGASLGLMFLDLDNFKSINDSLGHAVGDRFLREVALRLKSLAPAGALLSRYSGDQFAIALLPQPADSAKTQASLRILAERVLLGMAEPYRLSVGVFHITASIGIATYPLDGQNADQLIGSAEAAVDSAKRNGRNDIQFAQPEAAEVARRSLLVASDIHRGLAAAEFEPYYQPIVDVLTNRVIGAEALLRWNHPTRGVLAPAEFLSIAERTGLLAELGDVCLKRAHEQAVKWQRRGALDRFTVAVNLSARQLQDRRVVGFVRQLHASSGADARCLEFEITESAVMERPELSQQTLNEFKELGYRLSLDDFGTGYSSLSYLQRLPIDCIKVDRSFVGNIETSRQSQTIVAATLALARGLSMDVVAEGVENAAQRYHLQDMGLTFQQGYLYAPPLPASEFEAWLNRRGAVAA